MNVRRAQTVRPGHRPSHSSSAISDFGISRDTSLRGRTSLDVERPAPHDSSSSAVASSRRRRGGSNATNILDLSTKLEVDEPEEIELTIEGQLRRDLREAEKEVERLTGLVASLQTQLASRPPLTKVQALEKEYNQLELLYHSTQRENQLCMAEIEKGKRREKILEAELVKLFGDDWQDKLDLTNQLNPANNGTVQSSPVMASRVLPTTQPTHPPRRPSVVTRGLSNSGHRPGDSPSRPSSPRNPGSPRIPSRSATALPPTPNNNIESSKPALLEHLEQVRSLILGMDQKLKIHDEKLNGMVAVARSEEKKYEKMLAISRAALEAPSQ
ncbi:hypothetical protein FRB99_007635 [Tulasnella sp. 403]|nr:hypothetical protein FRB99_007635 [Tulasnella sp. 403]